MKVLSENKFQYQTFSFLGYQEAASYAKKTKYINRFVNRSLYKCNLNKLEGIQEGLKTFEGMSLKQIAIAFTNLHSINMIKGCINHCLHCYANSQPFITRAPFESFKQIMDDILALKKRTGANPVSEWGSKYIDCYFDADGIDLHLFDKEGKKHDAVELGKMIHKSTGMKAVFDTNGWDRVDKERQQIAEDYVQKLLKKENSKHFYQINISLNPFNPKYVRALKGGYNPETYSPFIPVGDKYVELQKQKTPKLIKAEDDYREYIKNEANVLYTFTPLVLENKLGSIIRGLNKDVMNMEGFKRDDYIITLSNILTQLQLMYFSDLNLNRKVIKNQKMMKKALNKWAKLLGKTSDKVFSSGRMESFYKVKNGGSLEGVEKMDTLRERAENNYNRLCMTERMSATDMAYLKMINSDGKVYLYDNYSIIPTDIQLNTGNPELKKPFWIKVKDFVAETRMFDRM